MSRPSEELSKSSGGVGAATSEAACVPGLLTLWEEAGAAGRGRSGSVSVGVGDPCALTRSWSRLSSVSERSSCGAFGATTMSLLNLAKPRRSTPSFQEPSSRLGNSKRPCESVTVDIISVPRVSVTTAPGTGTVPKSTRPWYSVACAAAARATQARRKPIFPRNRFLSNCAATDAVLGFRKAVILSCHGRSVGIR